MISTPALLSLSLCRGASKQSKKETHTCQCEKAGNKTLVQELKMSLIMDETFFILKMNYTECIDIPTGCTFSEITWRLWHLILKNVSSTDLWARINVSVIMILFPLSNWQTLPDMLPCLSDAVTQSVCIHLIRSHPTVGCALPADSVISLNCFLLQGI